MASATASWTADARARLEVLLAAANERRTARTLNVADVEACVTEALRAELGFAWRHAGAGGDARAWTTICLAVRRDDQLVVSVARAHGDPTPASAWSDLTAWDGWQDSKNRAACQAWAGRRLRASAEVLDAVVLEVRTPRAADDGAALLAEVLAHPADDRPRLVYADFLTERGDVRGEYIARECAGQDGSELLAEHGERWAGVSQRLFASFRRGFVEHVATSEPDALGELEALLEREPVTSIALTGRRRFDVAHLAARAQMQRLERLTLSRDLLAVPAIPDSAPLLEALGATRWSSLRSLTLRGMTVGDDGLHALAQLGAVLPRLEELCIERDRVTAAGVGELLTQKWSSRLRRLSLKDNLLGASGAETLAVTHRLRALTHLSLAGNSLGDAGADALAEGAWLKRLEVLDLRKNRIGRTGLRALLESDHLRRVEFVVLDGNPLGSSLQLARQQWHDDPEWLPMSG
ncbi:MAG: TIGR02996 domain-containing protein [Myxococcaceae bacterium]